MEPPNSGNSVRKQLLKNHELIIPGIGRLVTHSIDQYLSEEDTIVHPPYQKVRFEKYTPKKNKSIFKKYFKSPKSLKRTKKQLNKFTNELLNFGNSDLSEIGSFSKERGSLISFNAKKLINTNSIYLPIVDLEKFSIVESCDNQSKTVLSSSSLANESRNFESVSHYIEPNSFKENEGFNTPWSSYIFLLTVVIVSTFILLVKWSGIEQTTLESGTLFNPDFSLGITHLINLFY